MMETGSGGSMVKERARIYQRADEASCEIDALDRKLEAVVEHLNQSAYVFLRLLFLQLLLFLFSFLLSFDDVVRLEFFFCISIVFCLCVSHGRS